MIYCFTTFPPTSHYFLFLSQEQGHMGFSETRAELKEEAKAAALKAFMEERLFQQTGASPQNMTPSSKMGKSHFKKIFTAVKNSGSKWKKKVSCFLNSSNVHCFQL